MKPPPDYYSITPVDRETALDVEQLGAKRKFWLPDPGNAEQRLLFKADDRIAGGSHTVGSGEDWAEKICCELAAALGIPHVHYELAIEVNSGSPGVVCENIAPGPTDLVLGNVLLAERDPTYPTDPERTYGDREHTIAAVAEAVSALAPPPAAFCLRLPEGIQSALEIFVGYVMFDALVANQDRHHQNWGGLRQDTETRLAPTFDHGAALGRNVPDEKRKRLLAPTDRRIGMEQFAAKAKSGFFEHAGARKTLSSLDAFLGFAANQPNPARLWLHRLGELPPERTDAIIQRVPEHRMSRIAREFTHKLIHVNQHRLLSSILQA